MAEATTTTKPPTGHDGGPTAASSPAASSTSASSGAQPSGVAEVASHETDAETSHGRTTIADVVVSKIAGIAAREVAGVHSLGGGAARVVGQLRERIPGGRTNLSQGVGVEVGERQAAVDIDIVADYGVAIGDLAEGIRQNVIGAVEQMTGLEVTEVNITVHDVFLDDDEGDDGEAASTPSRVQ